MTTDLTRHNGLTLASNKILVRQIVAKEESQGGILLTEETQKRDQSKRPVGELVAIGENLDDLTPYVGRNVCFTTTEAVAIFDYRGYRYIAGNKNMIVCYIDNPDELTLPQR